LASGRTGAGRRGATRSGLGSETWSFFDRPEIMKGGAEKLGRKMNQKGPTLSYEWDTEGVRPVSTYERREVGRQANRLTHSPADPRIVPEKICQKAQNPMKIFLDIGRYRTFPRISLPLSIIRTKRV
jgi:hypothetical protein